MHVNKLTIGEFLPKKLGLKKNVINAPKANVTRNALLSQTTTPISQFIIPEKLNDVTQITARFATGDRLESMSKVEKKITF